MTTIKEAIRKEINIAKKEIRAKGGVFTQSEPNCTAIVNNEYYYDLNPMETLEALDLYEEDFGEKWFEAGLYISGWANNVKKDPDSIFPYYMVSILLKRKISADKEEVSIQRSAVDLFT